MSEPQGCESEIEVSVGECKIETMVDVGECECEMNGSWLNDPPAVLS